MNLSLSTNGEVQVVEVFGDVDLAAAGQLYDTLVACVYAGKMKLVVDLSGVRSLTRASVRGLIVASKLFRSLKGEMRICCADAVICNMLVGTGFYCLLKLDENRETSLRILDAGLSEKTQKISFAPAAPGLMARFTRMFA